MQATYRVESWHQGAEVAELIAIEQSAGRSHAWEGISDESRALGSADVLDVAEVETLPHPLPTWASDPPTGSLRRAYDIQIRYHNWRPICGIGNLVNVTLGEPQHLDAVLALRLEAISFSPAEIDAFVGPVNGREVLAPRGDLVVAPIKPSAGLSPEEAAVLAYEAAMGGADVIKDDELAFPDLRTTAVERCTRVAHAVRTAEQDTGLRKQYWTNLITSPGRALRAAPILASAGADALIVAPALQGLDICSDLCQVTELPLIAHNAGATASIRVRGFGVALQVWVQLQRLAGADALLAPSPYGSFGISPGETAASLRAANCRDGRLLPMLYAHSGGVSPANVVRLKRLAPRQVVAFTSGSAIFDHPNGPRAGAAALRTAVARCGSETILA